MWKTRIFWGIMFTAIGIVNSQFSTAYNLIAAITMFALAAMSFNQAQSDYHQEKEEKKQDDNS